MFFLCSFHELAYVGRALFLLSCFLSPVRCLLACIILAANKVGSKHCFLFPSWKPLVTRAHRSEVPRARLRYIVTSIESQDWCERIVDGPQWWFCSPYQIYFQIFSFSDIFSINCSTVYYSLKSKYLFHIMSNINYI